MLQSLSKIIIIVREVESENEIWQGIFFPRTSIVLLSYTLNLNWEKSCEVDNLRHISSPVHVWAVNNDVVCQIHEPRKVKVFDRWQT